MKQFCSQKVSSVRLALTVEKSFRSGNTGNQVFIFSVIVITGNFFFEIIVMVFTGKYR